MPKFGALPFESGPQGKVGYGAPRRATSEIGARCLAAAMVATRPGAVEFSHDRDPTAKTLPNPALIDQSESEAAEASAKNEAA
jgi:hypothetical protein